MTNETKNFIYMILDIIDSINTTSNNCPDLIKIEKNTINIIKNELFNLLNSKSGNENNYDNNIYNYDNNIKNELIGILPLALVNKDKFPENESLAKLAEKSLNTKIPNWNKRSRNEIIGVIVSQIAKLKPTDLNKFLDAWKQFNNLIINNNNEINETKNFVDTWLSFFNKFKGE